MIDPNLEAETSTNHGMMNPDQHHHMAESDIAEAESLNETILKALKQSNEEMRKSS